jgi:ribbon-helix-helix CopG family protein
MGDTLTIRLSDELAEALRREARESGIPKGELVRQAIADHLHKSGSPSVMSRHFGTMRGPADLSTNKTYRRTWTKKR